MFRMQATVKRLCLKMHLALEFDVATLSTVFQGKYEESETMKKRALAVDEKFYNSCVELLDG